MAALATRIIAVLAMAIAINAQCAQKTIGDQPANEWAEQSLVDNKVVIKSSRLEIPYNPALGNNGESILAFRYENVKVPQGVKLTKAMIVFTSGDQSRHEPLKLRFHVEDNLTPKRFTTAAGDLSKRTKSAAFTRWDVPGWNKGEKSLAKTFSPNLLTALQPLVNNGQWNYNGAGNDIVVLVQRDPLDRTRNYRTGSTTRNHPWLWLGWEECVKGCGATCSADSQCSKAGACSKCIGTTASNRKCSRPTAVTTTKRPATCTAGRLPDQPAKQWVEQRLTDGSVYLQSNMLEFPFEPSNGGTERVVGLRYEGVKIPQGAQITKAMIVFTSGDESRHEPLTLRLQVENSVNPAPFTTAKNDVSRRAKSPGFTQWAVPGWNSGEKSLAKTYSPSLLTALQPLVNNRNWKSTGNNINVIITRDPSDKSHYYRTASPTRNHPWLWLEWNVCTTTTTTKKTTTTAPPPPPSCSDRCNSDANCARAASNCKKCRVVAPGFPKTCAPPVVAPPPPTCGDTCTSDATCNRASSNCRKCRVVFPGFGRICAQPATTTKKPTTAAPPPPPTCGDTCTSDASCNRATNNCRKCRTVFPGFPKICAQPATTTQKPTTAAPPPPPTCGDKCTSDANCNRASNNCRKCRTVFPGFGKTCAPPATTTTTQKPTTAAPPPPPTCGDTCTNDASCNRATNNCRKCRTVFPGFPKVCAPAATTTTTQKPTTAAPPPPPTCGDTCTSDANCNRASNNCRKCRTVFPGFGKTCAPPATTTKAPTTAAPPPRGCGSSCTNDAQCRYVGASSKCNSCQQLFPNGPKICIPPPPAPVTCPTAKPCEPVCPKMPKTRCNKDCKAAGMKYGTEINALGCEVCKCKPADEDECPKFGTIKCRKECKAVGKLWEQAKDVNGCDVCKCVDDAECPKFGEIKCRKECKASGQDWGTAKDANGCDVCMCVPKCEPFKQRKCNLDCKARGMVWGMKKDAGGCDTCECQLPEY